MATREHNKKRNAGLLWEFLVRRMSSALVEGDRSTQAAALKLLKHHFKHGSELLRELRLVRSLVATTVSSDAVAASILGEARVAARSLDRRRLEQEKATLLRDIAQTFRDDSFFEAHVEDYRQYATVQTLVNEWREPARVDLGRLARYEDELVKMLVTAKPAAGDRFLNDESPGTNRLAAHIMTKKLNEKYAGQLQPDQRELVRAYAFSSGRGLDHAPLRRKLEEAKARALQALDRAPLIEQSVLSERADAVRQSISAEQITSVDDAVIARALSWLRLSAEIDGTAKQLAESAGTSAHSTPGDSAPRLLVSSPEFISRTPALVKESRGNNDGFIVLSGILQKADTLNQNGRVYPRAILEREVRNYQKFINERRSTGELDHPDSSVVSYKNVSHMIIEAAMDADGVVRGRMKVLDTPSGLTLQKLIEGDVQIGISSRGVGSTRKQSDYVVVQDDFQLICWDAVSEPSTPSAFMLPESKQLPWQLAEGRPLTKAERIDRVITEMLLQ